MSLPSSSLSASCRTGGMRSRSEATRLRDLLHDAFGPRDTAKLVARAAGVSHRTTERWVAGIAEPRASMLLRLACRCRCMRLALERMLDEESGAAPGDLAAREDRGGAAAAGKVEAR